MQNVVHFQIKTNYGLIKILIVICLGIETQTLGNQKRYLKKSNLFVQVNEVEKIRKWRSEAKELSNNFSKIQDNMSYTISNSALVLKGGAILENIDSEVSTNQENHDNT